MARCHDEHRRGCLCSAQAGAVVLCLTIIGIPLGLGDFKLIPVSLLPFGREIVSVDDPRATGLQPPIRD